MRWKELPQHLVARVRYDSGPARLPGGSALPKAIPIGLKGNPAGRKMNKWEHSYMIELQLRQAAGEIIDFHWQSVNLRLASGTWYLPDFDLLMPSGRTRLVEVKGFMRDDSAVKIKVAAEMYSCFEFELVTRPKGANGFVTVWTANLGALRRR